MSSAKLKLAIFTSCRELLSEGVGTCVSDHFSGLNLGYRTSFVRSLFELLQQPDHLLTQQIELCCIVFDDDSTEISDSTAKQLLWGEGKHKYFGQVVHERISSLAARNNKNPAQRSGLRESHQAEMLAALEKHRIDVALSDSFLTIFNAEFLNSAEAMLLNLHPGICDINDPACCPGLTPTRDAYTRAVHGFIITDDKRCVPHPKGPRIQVSFEGRTREAVRVPKLCRTGVTVHCITEDVDRGPVIAVSSYDFDASDISMELLRHENYKRKLAVFIEALNRLEIRAGNIQLAG